MRRGTHRVRIHAREPAHAPCGRPAPHRRTGWPGDFGFRNLCRPDQPFHLGPNARHRPQNHPHIVFPAAPPFGKHRDVGAELRGAFFCVVPLAVLALLWQWISLPPLPGKAQRSKVSSVFALLLRPQVALGMASIFLLFMGQFALFTYLRPFVETVTHLRISMLSLTLLVMVFAGVAGTWCISRLLRARLYSILIAIPLVMAVLAGLLVLFGSVQPAVAALLAAWGFFGTAAPVGWGTWLSRVLRDEAERGGGLQVAIIQFAITAGAALGGVFFDQFGWSSTFTLAAALLLGSSFAAAAAWFNNERRANKSVPATSCGSSPAKNTGTAPRRTRQ